MAHWIKLAFTTGEPLFEFDDAPENILRFGLSLGLPIGPGRLPTRAHETIGRKSLPDIFPMPGLNAVSRKFREIVEEFEPRVHQFFPLDLFYKNGQPVEDEYFIFNCTISLDSIIVDQSDIYWLKLDSPNEYPRLRIGWRDRLVLSRAAIASHHLWCGARIRHTGILVSDEFHARLKQSKFKYFDSFFLKEVDSIWIAEENIHPILEKEKQTGLEKGMIPWLKVNPNRLL
ncbi:DUF1629 domain-containing protein [uncultured Roseibium sp.]|uniref:imm11 family protein n=1 Tax=uncultured Roseibium sp. TaxID=1936171 RepID=UPI00262B30F2|nr:DUF1629 domain-containing protein [uncultured Roseibium sp.]